MDLCVFPFVCHDGEIVPLLLEIGENLGQARKGAFLIVQQRPFMDS